MKRKKKEGIFLTGSELHYKKMTETPVAKLIISLGIPTTISMLITSIYNMADTYFVGMLGESAQAATGVMYTLQCIIQGIAFMLGHGGGTFISKYLAARDTDQATSYISSAFYAGGAVGVLIMVLGLCVLSPMVYVLGSTDTIAPHAMDYGLWVLLGCPFVIMSMILNNALRYEGRALYAMVGLTIGGILNIFSDWLLVVKLNMGVFGAGMATAVSQFISFLILLFMFSRMAQSKLRFKTVSRDWRVYLSICHVGFPSLIRQGLTSITTGVLNNLTRPFGDAAIAAMSVVSKYSMFLMCVGLGMGQGFQPVAAFNYQAKKYKRVKQGLVFTMCFGLVFIGIISLVSIFGAEQIITLFQKKQEVIDVGKVALRYAAIGMMFMPFSVPVNMLYQSIQKPTVSSVLSLIRSGAVTIPILLICVPLIGLTGVQIAQPTADIIAGLISLPFIIHFLRKHPNE